MPGFTARPARTSSVTQNASSTGPVRRTDSNAKAGGPSPVRRRTSRPRSRPSGAAAPSHQGRGGLDDLPVQIVSEDDLRSFADLGLSPLLVQALHDRGIQRPFPIQAATIPDALTGRDLLGRAATGSGKTLAFGLAVLSRLGRGSRVAKRPRALILVPTRELAMQVTDALAPIGQSSRLSVVLVAGGLPMGRQISALAAGTDVLVATPGRLVDLLERRAVYLDAVEITVLDEADHMADLGFLPVVRRLLDLTPATGQRLLFSATLDGDVATLVRHYLVDPVAHAVAKVEADQGAMVHHLLRVQPEHKVQVVTEIAAREGRTILFTRTKHGADRLAKQLCRAGVLAGVLHGGRSQSQRTTALEAFKSGRVPVLVATDVAARGIHVDDISLVLHVDPPADGKDYVHRCGRTARAGSTGIVVALAQPGDERAMVTMLDALGIRARRSEAYPGGGALPAEIGARTPSGVAVVSPASAIGQNRPAHAPRRDSAGRPVRAARPDGSWRPERPARAPRRRSA